IEGIDELAKKNGQGIKIAELTERAMSETGLNPALYRERLTLVSPKKHQVMELGKLYHQHRAKDVEKIIAIFKRLNKTIYVISSGLFPAVNLFAEVLQIPQANIFAVNIEFDSRGNFKSYDESSPLVDNNGKRII